MKIATLPLKARGLLPAWDLPRDRRRPRRQGRFAMVYRPETGQTVS